MIRGRGKHSVEFVDQVLYICGGYLGSGGGALDDVEAYDTVKNKCTPSVGKLAFPVHSSGNCVAFNSTLYIFGGIDADNIDVKDVQVYDTKLNTCSRLSQEMPIAAYHIRAVLWEETVILLSCDNCFLYNFETATWKERNKFKTDVFHFGLIAENNKIYVGGGFSRIAITGMETFPASDKVKYIPIANILEDKSVEWGHQATLSRLSFVYAFGKIESCRSSSHMLK